MPAPKWMKYATPADLERYDQLTVRGQRKVANIKAEVTAEKRKIRGRAKSKMHRALKGNKHE